MILQNAKVWCDSLDLSGDLNAVAIAYGAEKLDATTFGADTRIGKAGLKTVQCSLAGIADFGTGLAEEFLAGKRGLIDVPLTISPTSGLEGEPAYFFKSFQTSLAPFGSKVGDLAAFSLAAEASSAELVRGTVIHNATRTGNGTGTAFNLGAVSATQSVFAALHVLAITGGGTLTVTVQSDTANNFPSPVTALPFAGATVVGSQWQQTTGANADTWWRVSWTLTGTSPSALFVVSLGIQ